VDISTWEKEGIDAGRKMHISAFMILSHMVENRDTYKVKTGNPEVKRPLGKPTSK
jgi:hypothetical protein